MDFSMFAASFYVNNLIMTVNNYLINYIYIKQNKTLFNNFVVKYPSVLTDLIIRVGLCNVFGIMMLSVHLIEIEAIFHSNPKPDNV